MEPIDDAAAFARQIGRGNLLIEGHAKHAMRNRNITLPDVFHVLFSTGKQNRSEGRTRFCEMRETWTYSIEGADTQGRTLRVVVYFKAWPPLPNESVMVITVVDLT